MAKRGHKRFFLVRHAKASALLVSLFIHTMLVYLALSIVVSTFTEKKNQAFTAQKITRPLTQPRKLTVPVTIRKVKPLKPKMRDAAAFNREVKTVELKLSEMMVDTKKWDIPDSYGGLGGVDMDLDINFFGVMGGGTHVVFILDYSPSMAGEKEEIMRLEAVRIIDELAYGTHFAVIFFGGLAWPAGVNPDLGNWVMTDYDWQTCRPKDWNALPQVKYKKASYSTKSNMINEINTTPLIDGTVYDCPIYMALRMNPVPDTIFFMTDGEGDTERGIVSLQKMVDQLTAAGKRLPVMHTVGFGVSHSSQLEEMAELMRGECRFVTPWEYGRKYGRDRSRPARRKLGSDFEMKVESVSADQYPVEFSLQ